MKKPHGIDETKAIAKSSTGFEPEILEISDLTNGERAVLRSLNEPGGPLWKVLKRMLDYGEGLQQSLLMVNVWNDDQRSKMATIQATGLACIWVQQNFEAAMTDVFEPQQETK